MFLLPLFIIVTPALAHLLVPGLAVPAMPQCTLVTVYYNDALELASATSSLFESAQRLCTTSTEAATTAIAAPMDSCVFSADQSVLRNGGFECTDNSQNPWDDDFNHSAGTFQIITSTDAVQAHTGNGLMMLQSLSTNRAMSFGQLISPPAGKHVTITFWAMVNQPEAPDSRCNFGAGTILPDKASDQQAYWWTGYMAPSQVPPTTSWTQYAFTGPVTNSPQVYVFIVWMECANILYVDDVTVTYSD